MKNLFLLFIILVFSCACGVRKNWKSVKNATWILQNQPIELARDIYGMPSEVFPTTTGNNTIYIWGNGVQRLKSISTDGTTTLATKNQETFHANSIARYDYTCYIALKVNANGKIIDAFQEGFESDALSQGCRNIFLRSKEFCNTVGRFTKKQKNVQIGNCHRNDISKKGYTDFAIPPNYNKGYINQKDDFFNN